MSIKFNKFLLFFSITLFFYINTVRCADNYQYYEKKGIIEVENDMYEFAVMNFTKAIRLNPKANISMNYLAKIYLIRGQKRDALNLYLNSIEVDQTQDEVLYIIGDIYDSYGFNKDALLYFEKSVSQNSKNYRALIGLARHYSLNKKYDQSTDLFKKASDINFNQSQNIFLKAEKEYSNKKFSIAESYYLEAIKINPAHDQAYYNLSKVYRQTRQYKKAITIIEKLKYLQPHDDRAYFTIANIYYSVKISKYYKKQLELAVSYTKKAIDLNPKNLSYHELLRDLYILLEMNDEAKNVEMKIIELSK